MYWFLVKAIISGIISSSFGEWFLRTKAGTWFQQKLDRFLNYVSYKYDIHITKTDAKWRRDYPLLAERIDKLEEWTHPPVAPGGATELQEQIEELRKEIQELKNAKLQTVARRGRKTKT